MNIKSIKKIFLLTLIILLSSCKKSNVDFLNKIESLSTQDTLTLELNDNKYSKQSVFELNNKFNLTETEIASTNMFGYKKINLSKKFHSLIAFSEVAIFVINFDKKGNFIDYFDATKCSGSCKIIGNEICCNQGYGYPYDNYQKIIINENGNFVESFNYIPDESKKTEPKRLNFILNKISFYKKNQEEIVLLPYDEDFYNENYPNLLHINKKELFEVFLKNHSSKQIGEKVKLFKEIMSEINSVNITFNFKLKIGNTTILPIILYGDQLDDFEAILLSYNNDLKLIDIFYNDFNLSNSIEFSIYKNDFVIKKIETSSLEVNENLPYTVKYIINEKGFFKKLR